MKVINSIINLDMFFNISSNHIATKGKHRLVTNLGCGHFEMIRNQFWNWEMKIWRHWRYVAFNQFRNISTFLGLLSGVQSKIQGFLGDNPWINQPNSKNEPYFILTKACDSGSSQKSDPSFPFKSWQKILFFSNDPQTNCKLQFVTNPF